MQIRGFQNSIRKNFGDYGKVYSRAPNGSFRWNICSEGNVISSFLINAFCFRRDKNDVLGTEMGQLGFSERQ